MKLLAVDTATEACSAALFIDGELTGRDAVSPRDHTKLILPMIDELMAEAKLKPNQLDALAFGRGPGSFTGVRIAAGVIQGIAFAHDLPVAPISNLAAVTQGFFDTNNEDTAFVAMDARMDEIYWAVYRRSSSGLAELIGQERVTPAEAINFPDMNGVGVGTGWDRYSKILSTRLGKQLIRFECGNLPRASAIAKLGVEALRLGKTVPAELALPVYLRDKVAKKEKER